MKQRLLALDILRGITIAGMILVNNPGTWAHIYAPLRHAEWNGLTPTDLVFPFFMFIMGISTFISLQKYEFRFSADAARKIVKRSVLIFLIGMAIGWFSRFCYYWAADHEGLGFGEKLWESVWTFDRMRILGVMQRLALCYCGTAIIALTVKHKRIPYIIAGLLITYTVLLLCGNGYAYNETNINSIVDRAILTPAHMYKDNGIDPEGLLSTLPALAHVLLGFWVGKQMLAFRVEKKEELIEKQLIFLFFIGAVLMIAGWLLSYGLPINKKIWSPTFVLTTCGMASTLLAVLIYIIDLKEKKKWCRFFESFGINPLFMYVSGGVLSIIFGSIGLHRFVYNDLLQPLLGDTAGSLVYAIGFVAVNWCIGYQLYKRKIYIKL